MPLLADNAAKQIRVLQAKAVSQNGKLKLQSKATVLQGKVLRQNLQSKATKQKPYSAAAKQSCKAEAAN